MILRYPGGKAKKSIREKIMSFFPDTFYEYRECMVGGGGIFFAIPENTPRWINDRHAGLIDFYIEMRDHGDDFIEKCKSIDKNNMKIVFEEFKAKESCSALEYFFINRTGWMGRVNYQMKSRMFYSNPSGWNILSSDKIALTQQKLQGVKITCTDYSELIQAEGTNVLIYIDPPYYKNTELAPSSQLYEHNFDAKDHITLCSILKSCKHKFCLSYDSHPIILDLYKDFNINFMEWTYCGTSSMDGHSKTKRVGQELLIRNY